MMLIGNKNDLERTVTTEEAIRLAQQNGMAYAETSACTGCNVISSLDKLFLEIYEQCPAANVPSEQPRPVPLTKESLSSINELSPKKKKSCC